MCKCCEQGKTLKADRTEDGAEITIVHDDERGTYLYVEAFCQNGYDGGYGYFKVNYCPVCGRKLRW